MKPTIITLQTTKVRQGDISMKHMIYNKENKFLTSICKRKIKSMNRKASLNLKSRLKRGGKVT